MLTSEVKKCLFRKMICYKVFSVYFTAMMSEISKHFRGKESANFSSEMIRFCSNYYLGNALCGPTAAFRSLDFSSILLHTIYNIAF